MARRNRNTNLQFYERDEDGNDIININISWENGDNYALQTNLNTWLRSIGAPLKVIAELPKHVECQAEVGRELQDPAFK
jgi:tRNA threonylcarbamoyladenosine modification (KEOPS) complex  Pcc1 subunit